MAELHGSLSIGSLSSPSAKSVGAYGRMVDLQNEIDMLNDDLDNLADRLGPVLRASNPAPESTLAGIPAQAVDSDLTELVNKAGRRLADTRRRIQSYRDRVDL